MKQLLKPSTTVVDSDGVIPAGKVYIEFILSTDFSGTINGAAVSGADIAVYDLPARDFGSFSEVPYTISAGSATLTYF